MFIINKVCSRLWMLRSLPKSVYFNFKYLPFCQAVKLPIILYKPKLLKMAGEVILDVPRGGVKFGMIKLGNIMVSLYPNSGIVYENHGGRIIFKGRCSIGNSSALSVGKKAEVIFGDRFCASTSFRLTSYCGIEFKDKVSCGWDCLFMDTDFHRLTMADGSASPKGYGKIQIGKGCWFGTGTIVQKNTYLPPYCVVAVRSVLNHKYDIPEKSLVAGSPAVLKKTGVYRDIDNDVIDYSDMLRLS